MSDELPQSHKGKIGRLPARIREAVNRRLNDGEAAPELLAWLNGLTEVKAVLLQKFSGEEVNAQNLSAWRLGGYQIWLKEQKQIKRTRDRANFSMELAKASGGNLAEGALAQLTGEVMGLLDEVSASIESGVEVNPKLLTAINKSLVAARARELETQSLALNRERLAQQQEELQLKKDQYRLKFAADFLKWFDEEETRRIANSGERKETKVKELVQHWFGEMPEDIGPEALN